MNQISYLLDINNITEITPDFLLLYLNHIDYLFNHVQAINILYKQNIDCNQTNYIWSTYLGLNIRLNSDQCKHLIHLINKLVYFYKHFISNYNINKEYLSQFAHPEEIKQIYNNFYILYIHCENCITLINNLIADYKLMSLAESNNDWVIVDSTLTPLLTNQNEKLNINWFYTLELTYTKIGGKYPTTIQNFIYFFQLNWDKLSDIETHTITDIFLVELGGHSIHYNIYCLTNWILNNKDCIKNSSDYIL
jgi:hypothetical protein